jgi:hypothetical protein
MITSVAGSTDLTDLVYSTSSVGLSTTSALQLQRSHCGIGTACPSQSVLAVERLMVQLVTKCCLCGHARGVPEIGKLNDASASQRRSRQFVTFLFMIILTLMIALPYS